MYVACNTLQKKIIYAYAEYSLTICESAVYNVYNIHVPLFVYVAEIHVNS